eukprot:TRINITY_DN1010_c0_g1_i1.p1 TRINITY_DN1010_c0_g1~~TRINITY_DN1010_c0_g1_i1.p1  ORF type:complete len:476 (+),score=62.04 TRINITY_DN1010_c0_g1_i1:71-1498(+)
MAYSTAKTNSVNYDLLRQLSDLPSPSSNDPHNDPNDLVEVPPPYESPFGGPMASVDTTKPDDKIKNILSFFPNQPSTIGDHASDSAEHRQTPPPSQLPFTPTPQPTHVGATSSTFPGPRDFYPSIPSYHQPTQHPSSPPPSFHQSQSTQSMPNPSPGFAPPSATNQHTVHSRPIPSSQVTQWTETQNQQKPIIPQETQYREMFNAMKTNFERMSTVMDRVERRLQNLEGLVQQVVKNQKDGENSLAGVVSNDEIHAMRKIQEQLDADVEFAKKLQNQFDQASKGQSNGNRVTPSPTPVPVSTPTPTPTPLPTARTQTVTSSSECPICTSRVPMNELEDHVNACLESIGGGSPSSEQKTDAEAKVGFWKKLWAGTPKKEEAQPTATVPVTPQVRTVSPKATVIPQRYPQPVSYGYRPTTAPSSNPLYYAPNNYNMAPPMSTGMYPVIPGQPHPAMPGGQPMFYYYPQDMPQPGQKK